MSDDPVSSNHPDIQLLGPESVDRLGRAVLTLAKELCVVTDRLLVLEALLSRGERTNLSDKVDRHQPDEHLQDRIKRSTAPLIAAVIADLSGS